MKYFAGEVGQSGGKLHAFREDPETGRARLETRCSVEWRVGRLVRSGVREDEGAADLEELADRHGDRFCCDCLR